MMVAAPAPAETPLYDYLTKCGGRDILVLETSEEASEAVRGLRERLQFIDSVKVYSSYNKVFLELTPF